jgi:hypothetical protein
LALLATCELAPVLESLSSAPFLPFSIAGGVMLGLLALEIVFAVAGKPLSALIDHIAGHDAHAPELAHADHADVPVHGKDAPVPGKLAEALAWLNAGRVPGLILLILALAWFAAGGFALQGILATLVTPLPGWIASLAALAIAVPPLRLSSRAIAHVIPRDESYAASHGDLVGMTGTVVLGPVRKGVVAKARFRDQHGNVHFPRIEPFRDDEVIEQGTPILAVEARGSAIAVTRAKPTLTGRID